jgi:transketolase
MRPADLVETAECWELALMHQDRPSLLALSRQGVPALREDHETNKSAKGAYVLDAAEGPEQVRIFATGTELYLARDARAQLKAKGINAAVVSVPCMNLFFEQDDAYRAEVIGGKDVVKVAIEAAVRFGWDSLIGQDGIFVGMKGFGDSGPAPDLYKHFNITAEAVTEAVSHRLQR